MPPSGFSQEAINGLLDFVRDIYQNTLDRYQDQDLTEVAVLEDSIQYLDKLVETSAPIALETTVSPQGVKGLQRFVSINFRDLLKEIHVGKKQEGTAMQIELEHIGKYLEQFKL